MNDTYTSRTAVADSESEIDIYQELLAIFAALESAGAPYCLVGGWAVGFHATPRATKDIDLLTLPEASDHVAETVISCSYFESATPWTFSDGMTLRRFAKCRGTNILLVDLLSSPDDADRTAVSKALPHHAGETNFRLIRKADLIRMKRSAGRPRDLLDLDALGVPINVTVRDDAAAEDSE